MKCDAENPINNLCYALSVIFCLFFLAVSAGYANDVTAKAARGNSNSLPLEVVVRADRSSYKVGDAVGFQISLINKSNTSIFVYADMEEGESASYSLWLKNVNSGKDVDTVFLADALTPPPHSRDDFIRIPPNYFYGVMFSTKLVELNINSPGTYEVVVEYHSPIPESMSFGLPIWSRESGTIASGPIQIRVKKASENTGSGLVLPHSLP